MKISRLHSPGVMLALVIVALPLAGATADTPQQDDYSLAWVTVAGGGASLGGDYAMVGGVWGSPIAPRLTYLPLVLR